MLAFLLTIPAGEARDKVTRLYRRYHRKMFTLAIRRLRAKKRHDCRADAEDVVQSTFMKISRHLSYLPPEEGSYREQVYVLAILNHELYDLLESTPGAVSLEDHPEVVSHENFVAEITTAYRLEQVRVAIERMDEIYRVTFILRFFEGRSVAQVAEILEVSPKTVESRILRGREILKKMVDWKGEEEWSK